MSNHFSAANLKFPGDDARLHFTDLFVFQSPDDPGQTVLIIDANPLLAGGPQSGPPSACAATARSCRWTGAAIRR